MTRNEHEQLMYDKGKVASTEWATNAPEDSGLLEAVEFLDEIRSDPMFGSVSSYCQFPFDDLTPSEVVCRQVFCGGEIETAPAIAEEFFEEVIGVSESTRNDPHFLEGFIDGMVEVYKSKKGKV